ncbi:MAG: cell division protein ZapA [Acidobacteria bacterium]|nr:cell division protein ZapA [Acidobacteriota bacterium]
MPAKGTTTAVEIFGSVYYVRGEDDGDSLRELAATVDRRMREIAEQVTTVDTAKIAILTALNLADELSRCRELQEGERVEIRKKVAALTGELEQALQRS